MENTEIKQGFILLESAKQEYAPKVYKTHKTTEQHFEWYKDEINKVMSDMGMNHYQYTFAHCKDKEYRAKAMYTSDNRCSFLLSTLWCGWEEPTEERIRTIARHEVAHVLIGKLHLMGIDREFNETVFTDELEAYAHRMEKFLTNVATMRELLIKATDALERITNKNS